jgi:hypothetical protein
MPVITAIIFERFISLYLYEFIGCERLTLHLPKLSGVIDRLILRLLSSTLMQSRTAFSFTWIDDEPISISINTR